MPAPAAPTALALDEVGLIEAVYAAHLPGGYAAKISIAKLTYTNNAGSLANHRLEMSSNGGTVWTTVAFDGFYSDPWVHARGIANAASLLFRLRAESAGGVSAWTASLAVTTGPIPAPGLTITAPGTPTVADSNWFSVRLGWENNANNAAGVELELEMDGVVRTKKVPWDYYVLEEFTIYLNELFGASQDDVANRLYTARVRAYGVLPFLANAERGYSDWSARLIFATPPVTIYYGGLAEVRGEVGVPVSYTLVTNRAAATFSVTSGTLPAGVTLSTGVLAGTPSAVADTVVHFLAADGALTVAFTIRFVILPSSISIVSARAVEAPQDIAFTYTIVAVKTYQAAAISGYDALNLPDWLTRDGDVLSGTPTVPGVWVVQVSATNGTQTGRADVVITVPALAFTSAASITGFALHQVTHDVTFAPTGGVLSSGGLPSWLTRVGNTLRGTPPAPGVYEVFLLATLDGETARQTLTITAVPVFAAPEEAEGFQGDLFFERVAYVGPGYVSSWQLSGAPKGLRMAELPVGAAYVDDFFWAITGTPTEEGRFQASLSAVVRLADESVHVFRHTIIFAIQGALYLPWLHIAPTLIDLQAHVRGGITRREVRSYYERAAVAATGRQTITEQKGDADSDHTSVVTEIPATEAAPGHLLTLKTGDTVRLALVVRDGRLTLGDPTVQDVRLAFRLADAADDERLFEMEATHTSPDTGQHYWLVEFPVTSELLADLMSDDNLSTEDVQAEITWTQDGLEQSSETFTVSLGEQVQ